MHKGQSFNVILVRRIGLLVAVAMLLRAGRAVADTAPVNAVLANGGQAVLPIVVSATAVPEVRQLADTLARYLGLISGARFEVKVGDGKNGIVVGTTADFAGLPLGVTFDAADATRREEYILRSHARGVYVVGATVLAVQDAVWDMLHRLGYRQFFPSEHWEIVPNLPQLSIAVDAIERPDYLARRIWYGWGSWPANDLDKTVWDQKNRMVSGLEISTGHAYDRIYKANQPEFERHPEYVCSMRPLKFCISNPGLQKLVVGYALDYFEKHPEADSISMEPSDGGGWDDKSGSCPDDKVFKSISDRALTLANIVADAVNQKFKNKYVGIYAYYTHSPAPTIRVEPNVVVSVATAFLQNHATVDQIMGGWAAQGAVLGVREYYSVVVGHKERPGGPHAANVEKTAASIPHFYDLGARYMSAESGDDWGPAGLGYYVASRLLWHVRDNPQAIVDDFYDKAFGPAQQPMREFYMLIDGANKPVLSPDLIGKMYRRLDAARRLTADAGIRSRLDDLALYTRYVELLYALHRSRDKAPGTQAVLSFAYRIHGTCMVSSYALWRDTRGGFVKPVGDTAWNVPEGQNPWKSTQPFTDQEIDGFIEQGIANNPIIG